MYIPERGDIARMDFDPTFGHEQSGVRPALVMSGSTYNNLTGMCIVVPITSKVKLFKYEVNLGDSHNVKGVVLSDQIRSIDFKTRKLVFLEKCSKHILEEVAEKSQTMLV